MERQIRVTGVYLEEFMEVLRDVYERGADYADIVVIQEGNQSIIRIEVKEEYMTDGENDEGDEVDEKLTDETLKGLIDG